MSKIRQIFLSLAVEISRGGLGEISPDFIETACLRGKSIVLFTERRSIGGRLSFSTGMPFSGIFSGLIIFTAAVLVPGTGLSSFENDGVAPKNSIFSFENDRVALKNSIFSFENDGVALENSIIALLNGGFAPSNNISLPSNRFNILAGALICKVYRTDALESGGMFPFRRIHRTQKKMSLKERLG